MNYTATYSPDDNKLRLYATSRLDKDLYDRVKAAGFKWAPKQDLFVAPMWTPEREDLLIELAGEIDDEDTSLVNRAEERADRFEDYSDKRANDAERARSAVSAIADNIPFGQPILVGHHSERHARKDAERIENGMRKAIKMWETSTYWKERAAGALSHAKYKELPGVRHRRIKGILADKRKAEKEKAEAEKWLKVWIACGEIADPDKQLKTALDIANFCHLNVPNKEGDKHPDRYGVSCWSVLSNSYPNQYVPRTVAEVVEHAKKAYPRTIARRERWINHYENRIAYETAMLDEQIGADGGMSARFDIKPGGKVLTTRFGEKWSVVLRVNKAGGVINSVTVMDPGGSSWKYGIEHIKDYQGPTEELAAKVKKATALPQLCNYPGEGFREMTEAEWKAYRDRKSCLTYVGVKEATETIGKHRVRQIMAGDWKRLQIFITDGKRVDPPKPEQNQTALPQPERITPRFAATPRIEPERTAFDDMKDTLKAGIKVVSAPQLFPTPREVADQVIELADIQKFDRVLEPSAGTGVLVDSIGDIECGITAIEINQQLASALEGKCAVRCADFLQVEPGEFGEVDRVVMNPPFENGIDIKHVEHAIKFLRKGGRLVSIVANGPRQQAKLKPMCSNWIELPPGSFKNAGTNVNAAIAVIDKAS